MNNKFDELTRGLAQSVTRRAALKKFGVGLAGMALACFGLATSAEAGSPTFATLDYPGAVFTAATDINASGQICGVFIDTSGVYHGFLLSGGGFSSISVPGAVFTAVLGINRQGDIVGMFSRTQPDPSGGNGKDLHGFLLHKGAFNSIDVPGAAWTRAVGINRAGDVVGTCADVNNGKQHGYLLCGGVFTVIDVPGAADTGTWKINDLGEIAGRYRSGGNEKFHVFRLSAGKFTALDDFPGAAQTAPTAFCGYHSGQNDLGDVVSVYSDESASSTLSDNFNQTALARTHGFVVSQGVFTSIDFPGAVGTVAWGINNSGLIVGVYQDPSGWFRGYLRTPCAEAPLNLSSVDTTTVQTK